MRTPPSPARAPPTAGSPAPQRAPPRPSPRPLLLPVLHPVLLTRRWLAHKCRSLRAPSEDPELGRWQRNYRLNPAYPFSLFDEFMEMSTRGGAAGRGAGRGAGEEAQADRPRPQ